MEGSVRVLITGGSGFIGSWTVAEAEQRGWEPVILDRAKEGGVWSGAAILGDIRDQVAVTEAMAHVDSYIHLAGVLGTQETIQNPRPAVETNVIGGLNILEAASQYDLPGVIIAVGNHWMLNPYSISKSTVEKLAAMYRDERDLRVSVVRAFNAYGPGQSIAEPFGESKVRKIMPAFICRALTGQPIEVYGSGEQVMDMVYVGDVARVLCDVLALTVTSPFVKPVEAGTGRDTTVLEIAVTVQQEVERQAGSTSPIVHLPMRPGEESRSMVLAKSPYPLDKYVSLEDGVFRTVTWLRQEWFPTWNG
jgi:nucleoside-diphosphate-sugar epimerase